MRDRMPRAPSADRVDPAAAPSSQMRDVHKLYGGIRALNGLSLSIATGEVHCIVGPNGAGKSTFFKMLMGTERPTSGTIVYKGKDITR